MDIIAIIGVGIIGAIIINLLKNTKSELTVFATVASGAIILIVILNAMTEVIEAFNEIIYKTGLDSYLFSGVLKIIGIGYLVEYSANICIDCNCNSIADKLILAGKVTVFLMALPIIKEMINLVVEIIP
ncbi:MAG: SpoIIIAC/SpoIIIAD family protein [Christensenellales bacterium]